MTIRVGVNGFGRIGRNFCRAVAANRWQRHRDRRRQRPDGHQDARPPAQVRHRARHVSAEDVTADGDGIQVGGKTIKVLSERDPAPCPGATSASTSSSSRPATSPTRDGAGKHLDGGAKKVIISAPAKGEDITVVMGVNDGVYDPASHTICPTRPARPTASRRWPRCSHDAFGIEQGPDDDDPRVHQRPGHPRLPAQGPAPGPGRRAEHHPDHHRRGEGHRAGAAGAQGQAATATRCACRCPTARSPTWPSSSAASVTMDEVNAAFKAAAEGPLKGYLVYTEDPIVSSDIVGSPASCTFDSPLTMVQRQHGQGRRLVRQRVGLLQPARRPRRARRRQPVAVTTPSRRHGARCRATLDDLLAEGCRRQAGLWSARPQRAARRQAGAGRITDDGRIRASRADASRALARRAAPGSWSCAHLGRPKGDGRPALLAGPGRRPAGRAARRSRSPSPTDVVGELGRPTVAGARRRRRRAAGERPLRGRRRPARTTPSAAPSPTSWSPSAAARRLRRRRVRRRAPQAGQRLRRRAAAAALRRHAGRGRGRRAASS